MTTVKMTTKRRKYPEDKYPNYGMRKKKHSKKSKEKMHNSHLGKTSHRKELSLEEEYGKKKAKGIKEKSSNSHIKLYKTKKGKKIIKEHSKKMKGKYEDEKSSSWQGGKEGYWARKARKVAKKCTSLKKLKYPPIVVHHIDGNIKNYKKSNLLICTDSYHMWLHLKLRRIYGKNWRKNFNEKRHMDMEREC